MAQLQQTIRLRVATIDDLAILKHWDEQPHVNDSDPNDDWNWEIELTREVSWREQLMAECNGRPVGFLQIIDPLLEESHYWGEVPANLRAIDIWIGEKDDLGKGFGTLMMKQALDRCFQNASIEAVLIDPLVSNVRAIKFYQRLGFTFVENRLFGEDFCSVYKMDREQWIKMQ